MTGHGHPASEPAPPVDDGTGDVPLVTVVIPCHKQAAFLAASVRTALGQTHPAVEVIVVDDESPDDTPAVAAGFGGRIRYLRQPNAGVAGARNTGLSLATGEFVAFLDADDLLSPDMVERHLATMQAEGADVTAGGWRTVDRDGRTTAEAAPPPFAADAFRGLLPVNLAPPVCYMFRRSAVDAVGGFDPDRGINGHEDWDLLLRLALAGSRFAGVPACTAGYRSHAGSSSTQHRRMYDTARAVLAKTRRACVVAGRDDPARFRAADAWFRRYYDYHIAAPLLFEGEGRPDTAAIATHFVTRCWRDPKLFGVILGRTARRLAGVPVRTVRRLASRPPA